MSYTSHGTITISDLTDITDVYLEYGLALASATVTNSYPFNETGEVRWSMTYPTWQSSYQIWIRQVTEKEGLPNEYGTPYLDTAVNQLNTTISAANANITALQTRTKKIWVNLNNSTIYPAGTYAASGINNGEITENNSSTYGYNTFLTHNKLALRYNAIDMAALTTNVLTFYTPTQNNNNNWVQGEKGVELSTDGLILYNPAASAPSNKGLELNNNGLYLYKPLATGEASQTTAAQLTSTGLNITNGSIILGSASSTSSGSIALSNTDFIRSINGTSRSELRFAIGSKFGVKNDGTLYASNADISGKITVGSGSNVYTTDNVNPLEIGGRNLLLDTELMTSWYRGSGASLSDGVVTLVGSSTDYLSVIATNKYDIGLYDGETTYTWSFEYKCSVDCAVLPTIASSNQAIGSTSWTRTKYCSWQSPNPTLPSTGGKWVKYSLNPRTIATSQLTGGSGDMVSGFLQIYARTDNANIQIRRLQLEKGNKATDWTPAPEDVQSEIDAKNSVHTLTSTSTAGFTYAQLLDWSAEGYGEPNGSSWGATSTAGIKEGDTVRIAIPVSDMNLAKVYVVGTVVSITDSTHIKMISHGLDTTIIDGGNIITNSIGANQIKANAINSSKIAIGDFNNYVTVSELYADSIPFTDVVISDGYLTKKTATQQYIRLSKKTPNPFKTGDEFYVEFYAKAASATNIAFYLYGYDSGGTYINGCANAVMINNSSTIALTTGETFYSGSIKLSATQWSSAAYYDVEVNNNSTTKVQVYIRKAVVRRKSAGELIVDGAITTDKLAANSITVGKMPTSTQDQILNSKIDIGGRNILLKTGTQKSWTVTLNSSNYQAMDCYQTYLPVPSMFAVDDLVTISFDWSTNGTSGNFHVECGKVTPYTWGALVNAIGTRSATSHYVDITSSNKSGHVAVTFKITSSQTSAATTLEWLRIRIDGADMASKTFTVSNAKAERGNKATDWTPAPEDGSGANLLSYPYCRDVLSGSPYTTGGITFTLNKDGTVTAKGTATANAWYQFTSSQYPNNPNGAFCLPAGTYTISGCPSGGSSSTYRLQAAPYSLSDGTSLGGGALDYGNGATLTLTQSALIRFEIGILNGTACPSAGLTFKPMLEVGSMVHPFVSPVASEAASQSATKYVTRIDDAGIFVSPSNQSPTSLAAGNSVKINADGMYVYQGGVERAYFKADAVAIGTNGGNRSIMNSTGLHVYKLIDSTQTEVAFFGETARVGKASTQRVSITSTDVEMYSSDNVKRIGINANSGVTIGLSTKGHTIINDTGLSVYDTNNKKRTSISSSGLNIFDIDGSTSVALFGSNARVGKTSAYNIQIGANSIDYYYNGNRLASMESEESAYGGEKFAMMSDYDDSTVCKLSFDTGEALNSKYALVGLSAKSSGLTGLFLNSRQTTSSINSHETFDETSIGLNSYCLEMECRSYSDGDETGRCTLDIYPDSVRIDGNLRIECGSNIYGQYANQHLTNIYMLGIDSANNLILGYGNYDNNLPTYVEGGKVVLLSKNGSYLNSPTGTAVTSDRRLKRDIKPINESITSIFMDLEPVEYRAEQTDSRQKHIGFIAQDVEKVFLKNGIEPSSYAIVDELTTTNDEKQTSYKYLRYTEFIPLCVKMIQKQQREIEELKEALNEILSN